MATRTIDELLIDFGRLDDSPGIDSGRERFRRFLRDESPDLAALDDYVRSCQERSDEQHDRALQDLLNHIGTRLGFEVQFGHYSQLPGSIGVHGQWISPGGDQVVVEIRRLETHADQRPTLARLMEQLIRQVRIAGWDRGLGLYVLTDSRVDPGHLEKSILTESRADRLRIIRPASLLALARLMACGTISHGDVMTLLRSTSPGIDSLVQLVSRVAKGRATGDRRRGDVEWEEIADGVCEVIERVGDFVVDGLEAVFGSEPWWNADRR